MELKHFSHTHHLSFDDVLLRPGYSNIHPSQCNVATTLGKISLGVPLLSAAMDTVTEARLAIALSLEGGIGILHKNCDAKTQAAEVKRVKRFQHTIIADPETVDEDWTVAKLKEKIIQTGVTGFPVINSAGLLVGICTGRDIRYVEDTSRLVRDVMTAPVHTLLEGASRKDSVAFFQKHKVEKCPLVDQQGHLKGLLTSKDLFHADDFPRASRDSSGALVVGAAVGAGEDEFQRALLLLEARVDLIVVDSSHGHAQSVLDQVSRIREHSSSISLVGGNVATAEGAKALVDAGADIVKVGIGPGSICTTRIVTGVGAPQFTAVSEVAQYLAKNCKEARVIADGGIRYSGDITKALGAGAHAVMVGSLFAGTEESPGETILYQGRSYKSYRGMGSLSAMRKGRGDRYFQGGVKEESKLVPEGVEARVPYRGTLKQAIYQLVGGLRAGLGLVGAESILDLHKKAQFMRISPGALKESHVHDVTITAESPNYTGHFNSGGGNR